MKGTIELKGEDNPSKKPSWSWLLRKHLSQGSHREALVLFNRYRGTRSRSFCILGSLPLVLKACASAPVIQYGQSLHAEAIKNGLDSDVVTGTSLLRMYWRCGDISDSRKLFDYMPQRNVVSWNVMLGGYIRNGDMTSASLLLKEMPMTSSVTWNQMIHGFALHGDLVTARRLFDQVPPELKNVVTWTVMVDGYASKGDMAAAKELFYEMPERNFFVWSSMISGYSKIGDVESARGIFDQVLVRNGVIWNSLICGYAQNGFSEDALEAFGKMQDEGFEPDEVTVVSVLSACAQLGLLHLGKDIHRMIYRKGIVCNEFVSNALVDMYAKCGDLTNARLIFEGMACKNTACWNSMISGFGIHGRSKEALDFFKRMEEFDVKPDEMTFLSVLSACAHGGFVDEGLETFSKMERYGLVRSIKHYGCVVDLLGRAGRLKDAYQLINTMPMKPNGAVLGAFLAACRIHIDIGMTEQITKAVSKSEDGMDSDNAFLYALLSNVHAASDSWEMAEKMRMIIGNKGLRKTSGRSSVMLVNSLMPAMQLLP
ncbi:hypothetical protein Tsubulata_013793 [Turnera subulata]|uniref:Pentacotripeptide-repeat region of PRORP domain-containing protein n=1 Tax=Turnera subulata TaxID=218843 RepID=A0A9Q0GAE2_9ROSI|nr:hypothetical protein Tsubulata_013793 [Turnera subulata]